MMIEEMLEQMIAHQEKTLLEYARRIIPTLTTEDILQPYDYPELENNAHFRYEEGVLAGLMTAQAAIKATTRQYNMEEHNESKQ